MGSRRPKVNGVPANPNPATVINLSLGGPGTCSATLNNAITAAVTRGSAVVVAAGNSNMDVSTSVPANCANVIAVAATTSAGAKASFSNFGNGVDIAAPGQSIVSTLNTGTTVPGNPAYAVYSGTSMAAPHVAGVVALMQSVALNPLTPATVKALLKASARPLPVACTQGCGAGLVNADGAVAAVIASTTLTRNVARTGLSAALSDSLYYQVNVARRHTFAQAHARRWQWQCRSFGTCGCATDRCRLQLPQHVAGQWRQLHAGRARSRRLLRSLEGNAGLFRR